MKTRDANDRLREDGAVAVRRWADAAEPAKPTFTLVPFADLKPGSEPPYLVDGLIPRVGLAVVWGPPKCGKSFWAFDAAMHVALGREYRGHRVAAGPVVYCALEGAHPFKNRIEAFRVAKLAEDADADPPFFLMSSPLSLVADVKRFVADVKAQLGDAKPVLVIVDTLNRSIAGSENDDEAMGAYVRAADAIRAAFGCLVAIVHHCGYSADRPRGHSSLVGALDVQISIKRDANNNIVAELELAKDAAVGLKIVSRLKVVELGLDQDGDPVTSCVVEPVEERAAPVKAGAKRSLTKSAKVALQAFDKALAEVGEQAPALNHIPLSVRVVTVERWREYAIRCGISSGEDRARRKTFQSAKEALIAEGVIVVWEPYAWRSGPEPPEPT